MSFLTDFTAENVPKPWRYLWRHRRTATSQPIVYDVQNATYSSHRAPCLARDLFPWQNTRVKVHIYQYGKYANIRKDILRTSRIRGIPSYHCNSCRYTQINWFGWPVYEPIIIGLVRSEEDVVVKHYCPTATKSAKAILQDHTRWKGSIT